MTARHMAWSWISALMLLAGLIIGPRLISHDARDMPRADIYVIGTSLMAHGFPAHGFGKQGPFAPGQSFHRMAAIHMDEDAALDRLERALANRPDAVLIEANIFLFDFANRAYQRPCDGASLRLRHRMWQARSGVIDDYRALMGAGPYGYYRGDPVSLDAPQRVRASDMDLLYPLVLRPPCALARLQQLTAQAWAQGTRILWVLPPRAPVAEARLGQTMIAAVAREARRLAADTGAELYQPRQSFADHHFVDHAHLNRAGRQRFLADLQIWWNAGP